MLSRALRRGAYLRENAPLRRPVKTACLGPRCPGDMPSGTSRRFRGVVLQRAVALPAGGGSTRRHACRLVAEDQRTLVVFVSVQAALFTFLPGSGLRSGSAWECSKRGGSEEFRGVDFCS